MAFRDRLYAECDVTLGAPERRIGLSLLNLSIQHSFIRALTDVANVAGCDWNFQGLHVEHIYRRDFMTGSTTLVRMYAAFVPECAGRRSPAPFRQDVAVCDAHHARELGIEIGALRLSYGRELMTRGALV